jgi:hypothetical protein
MRNIAKTAACLLIAAVCLLGAAPAAALAQDEFIIPLQTGTISGVVFHDLNANCVWDVDDKPLAGWSVSLLEDDNATVLASRATDIDGRYEFSGLSPGVYYVTETIAGPEWNNTTPTKLKVEIVDNAEVFGISVDFGNEKPFLGFRPDQTGSPLPYTGKASNPSQHGSADGLPEAIMAALFLVYLAFRTRSFSPIRDN